MMPKSRDELIAADRQAWETFMALVDRVPADRRDVREVVPGWSVKDIVWHNVGWALFCAQELAKLDGLPYVDPFDAHDDEYWDAASAEQVESGRGLSWDEMLAQAAASREWADALWESLGELSPEAADWFAEETSVHYAEHGQEIERFLEG